MNKRVKPNISNRLFYYALLMRFDRPVGTFLLLWPTLWALWIASEGQPDMRVFTVFVLGVILMRAAGCVINDYADRHIDPHVQRTRLRPLAVGWVSPREALILFVILCLSAFALVLLLNALTIALSFGGALLAAVYPFMKRYTYMPQLVLGAAFAWAVPMAFAAQTGAVPIIAWLIFIVTVMWTLAYDTMYAMADRQDDLRIGVRSTAILFGEADKFIIGIIQTTVLLVLLLVGQRLQMSPVYFASLAVGALLFVYQQLLIRQRQPQACLRAFLNNSWFGLLVFVGIALHYATLP